MQSALTVTRNALKGVRGSGAERYVWVSPHRTILFDYCHLLEVQVGWHVVQVGVFFGNRRLKGVPLRMH